MRLRKIVIVKHFGVRRWRRGHHRRHRRRRR